MGNKNKRIVVGLEILLIALLFVVILLLYTLGPFDFSGEKDVTIENKTQENIVDNVSNEKLIPVIEEVSEESYTDERFDVKSLRISCDIISEDFNGDGFVDGINYYIRLTDEIGKVIPAEGVFSTEFFYGVNSRDTISKGSSMDYVQKGIFKGKSRLDAYDEDKGYKVDLIWDDFEDSLDLVTNEAVSNNIILKTTFTSKEGTIVKDTTGEFKNSRCSVDSIYILRNQ